MNFRKSRPLPVLLLMGGAIIAGITLFHISERVQSAEADLARIEAAAAKEAETIRVLRAEWAYLNRPDRLEKLAQKHLGMAPPAIQQVMVDSGALPPQPAPAATVLPVSAAAPVAAEAPASVVTPFAASNGAPVAAPPVPRLKPRHDTKDFRTLLDELQAETGVLP